MEIQTVLAQVNETEDRSSTNLDTVSITFQKLDVDDIIIDRDILRNATVILSDIQSWGMDDSSLDTLQNTSAEYVMCNYIYGLYSYLSTVGMVPNVLLFTTCPTTSFKCVYEVDPFCCGRIMGYFEEMTEKLARNEDLSQPLVVNTQNLAFHGQSVS